MAMKLLILLLVRFEVFFDIFTKLFLGWIKNRENMMRWKIVGRRNSCRGGHMKVHGTIFNWLWLLLWGDVIVFWWLQWIEGSIELIWFFWKWKVGIIFLYGRVVMEIWLLSMYVVSCDIVVLSIACIEMF